MDCPVVFQFYNLRITKVHNNHGHPLSEDVTTYAVHRKQPPHIMDKIYTLLASGHKDPVTSVMDVRFIIRCKHILVRINNIMAALNVKNILKKDIQNIQSMFLKNSDGKEMYSLISHLESIDYDIKIQVTTDQEVKGLFFISKKAILEARYWPETLIVDATYKTNAHKMSLVNIVDTSNVTSKHRSGCLKTLGVAAAFDKSETEESYTWI